MLVADTARTLWQQESLIPLQQESENGVSEAKISLQARAVEVLKGRNGKRDESTWDETMLLG